MVCYVVAVGACMSFEQCDVVCLFVFKLLEHTLIATSNHLPPPTYTDTPQHSYKHRPHPHKLHQTKMRRHTGYKICITCRNVTSIIDPEHLRPPLVPVSCSSYAMLQFHTNESVYAMADRLEAAQGTLDDDAIHLLEQDYGVKYNAHGVLYDRQLRTVYRPIDHVLRDWMHMLANSGVANTEIALMLHVAVSKGFRLETISEFAQQFTLPKKHGKVHKTWLTDNRLHDDTLSSFAAVVLCLVPVLLCFFTDVVKPLGLMDENILCFTMLFDIIGILCLGSEDAMLHTDKLRRLVELHAALFVALYPDAVKPKFHHLFHLVDNMLFLGKLLSCFVTERRHRSVKKAALHVFRYMEHTVLADLINRMCEQFSDSATSLFLETYLVNPRSFAFPQGTFNRSSCAILRCGEINAGDIVWLTSGIVGKATYFWQQQSVDDQMIVQIDAYNPSDASGCRFTEANSYTHFASANTIVDACIWIRVEHGLLRVIVPFGAKI